MKYLNDDDSDVKREVDHLRRKKTLKYYNWIVIEIIFFR